MTDDITPSAAMATLTLSSTGFNVDIIRSAVIDGILEGTETFTYTPQASYLEELYPGINITTETVTVSIADLESK